MNPSTAKRIALLGAGSTGKTTLAAELAAHLRARGLRAEAVPEVLREGCARAGRAPPPGEQLAIAQEQERRVDAAAAGNAIVIADTTALRVAIQAGILLEDGELLRFAIARQRGYDATLVMGLDVAGAPDRLQRDPAHPREEEDTLLRTLLQRAAIPFQVVYGLGPRRLQSALQALAAAGVLPAPAAPERDPARPWVWVCDKCSDPACEHRLFTQLQEARR